MAKKYSILGAGSWGTAFGRYLSREGHDVMVYGRDGALIRDIQEKRENKKYLPGVALPETLRFSNDLSEVMGFGDVLISAISSQHVRPFFVDAKDYVRSDQIIVNLSKGIEVGSLLTMSQVFAEILPNNPFLALSGPSHAEEVARDLPTTLVAASEHEALAREIQKLSSESLRIYRTSDVMGVESGAALKNVIALAVGISDGYGFGDNTKAAIMTRGMSEILRLGLMMGARQETYLGLSGFGDLIVTCTSRHSRNRHCGELIGKGMKVSDAIRQVGMVVEGISTMESAYELAKAYEIEMPITSTLHEVIHERMDLEEAVQELMGRRYKEEFVYE